MKLITLFCLGVAPLLGQTASTDQDRGISIEATALSYFEGIETVQLRGGKKQEIDMGTLQIPDTIFGPKISVSRRSFVFGILEANGTFRAMGEIKLPDAGRRFALVFAPAPEGYRVFPIRVDNAKVKGGDTVIFNFTQGRIGALVGGDKTVIETMQSAPLSPETKDGKVAYTSTLAFEQEDGVGVFYKGRWAHNPNIKRLLFIFTDPSTQHPVHRMLPILAGNE